MKKLLIAAAVAALGCNGVFAGLFKGIDEANWYAGPKLTDADLVNKVVVIYSFSASDTASIEMMPRIEQLWGSFKTKPFVIIASHRGGRKNAEVEGLVAKHKLTMPVYEAVDYAFDAPNTTLYVVSHRGLVCWQGSEDREATDAFVTALGDVGRPPDLVRGVPLSKARKSLKKKLVLGKPLKSEIAKLEKEVKDYAKIKKPNKKQTSKCEEAQAILSSIGESKERIKKEIVALKKVNPEESAKLQKDYLASFPGETIE